MILSLKRSGCSLHLLFKAYVAYIRPILLYAHPAVCNMSLYLRQKLEKVEKRDFRLIGVHRVISLFSVADCVCEKLFYKVLSEPMHPLRTFFKLKPARTKALRATCNLRRPRSKTQRFKNSFMKFSP